MIAPSALRAAVARGAPPRRALVVAVAWGAAAQLAGVALVGGATALLTWSARRPPISIVAGLLVAVELVAFVRAPLRHAARRSSHELGLSGLAAWRTWLLDAVATWSPSALAAARSGDLLSRLLGDADALQGLYVNVLVPVLSQLVALCATAVVLLALSPLCGVALLVATALVALVCAREAPRLAQLGEREAVLAGEAAARAVELAHGASALRLLGADASHVERTSELLARRDALGTRADAVVTRLVLLAACLGAATLFVASLVVDVGGRHPEVPAGVLLGLLACCELLAAVPATLGALGAAAGAARRLTGVGEPWPAGDADAPDGGLALRHAQIAASRSGPVLLDDVSLEVRGGSRVSLRGPVGSGKSTLLATAARLEPRRGGEVTLGGVDLDELDEAALRRRVAWLPSNSSLLEGRVRDVLDVGRGLGDDELVGALRAVGLWQTLEERGGLEAQLASRADDLSGGERRRLAVARLLAGRPQLCLLDEPTAGLDPIAADELLAQVAATGTGALVATHDARTAAWAQERLVVRDGGVAGDR